MAQILKSGKAGAAPVSRLGKIKGKRASVLAKINALIGGQPFNAEDKTLDFKVKAKIEELKKSGKLQDAEELGARLNAFESYNEIIYGMETNPQKDTEIALPPVTNTIKPSQLPLVDSPKTPEPSILPRLQELLERDTGWEPSKSGHPTTTISSLGPAVKAHIDASPFQKRKHNAHEQIPD